MASVADVTAAVENGEIILLQATAGQQLAVQLNILKRLTTAEVTVIHISTLRPTISMKSLLLTKGIVFSNIRFIDAVQGVRQKSALDDTVFVEGPQDLTGILIAVQNIIDVTPSKKVFFVESLNGLMAYNEEVQIVRLIHGLVNKMRLAGSGAVISAAIDKGDSSVTSDVGLFCDSIIVL